MVVSSRPAPVDSPRVRLVPGEGSRQTFFKLNSHGPVWFGFCFITVDFIAAIMTELLMIASSDNRWPDWANANMS